MFRRTDKIMKDPILVQTCLPLMSEKKNSRHKKNFSSQYSDMLKDGSTKKKHVAAGDIYLQFLDTIRGYFKKLI